MKKIDVLLTVLLVGGLSSAVSQGWANEMVGTLAAPQGGISAQDTFMKDPGARPTISNSSVAVGQVLTIDRNQNQLTLRDERSGEEKTFQVLNPSALDGLSIGTRVRIHDHDFRQDSSV